VSGGGIVQSIHSATEATASAISVAALIIWTLLVTGWTAMQVIQNALWYKDIKGLNLGAKEMPVGWLVMLLLLSTMRTSTPL